MAATVKRNDNIMSSWWETLIDDSLEDGVKGTLKWAWRAIGPWPEGQPKVVSQRYPEKSGLAARAAAEGFGLGWVRGKLAAEKILEGWEYVYEPDEEHRVKRRLIDGDESVLMKKAN